MAEKWIVLSVEGMGCQGCAETVREALEEVPGVGAVKVELELGRAEVEAHESVDGQALIAALDEVGYPAKVRS
jgi:copper chaperone CopZ